LTVHICHNKEERLWSKNAFIGQEWRVESDNVADTRRVSICRLSTSVIQISSIKINHICYYEWCDSFHKGCKV